MTNHVRLLLVPDQEDSLARGVGLAHQRYAQLWNRRHRQTGHLFEGRFYSAPLDDRHTWSAIRYIERNPLPARLGARAEEWPWSSAAAHGGLREDPLLDPARPFPDAERTGRPWLEWLALEDAEDERETTRLRQRTTTGRPCGDRDWVREVEQRLGRAHLTRGRGRPRLQAGEEVVGGRDLVQLVHLLECPTRVTELRRKLKLFLYIALLVTVVFYPVLVILLLDDSDISDKERFYFLFDGAVWFVLCILAVLLHNW